jgi:tyrosine-protein kinase Etk/Wzc
LPNETTLQTPDSTEERNLPREDLRDGGTGMMELLLVLACRKTFLICCAVAGGLVAGGAAFLQPNIYTATAIIMPPQQAQTAASAILGQLGPLAAVTGHDLALKSPSDLYIGLLGSRTIADHLIDRFALKPLYEAKTMMETRSKLKAHARFGAGRDSLIRVEVDDIDPKRAADIANGYVTELNAQNTAFGTTEAAQRRVFLENQLNQERTALAGAEDAMKKTQAKTGVIQVESQTSLAVATVAQLKAQITAGEVALERLKMGAAPQNPELLRAETEVAALREQLRRAEQAPRSGGDPMLSTSALPSSGLEYLRRLRDLKYHEFLFEMLSKQYEAARIDESKIAPALQVVDVAVPPDQKSGPHRGLIIVFGVVASLTFASVGVWIRHGVRDTGSAGRLRVRDTEASGFNGRDGRNSGGPKGR